MKKGQRINIQFEQVGAGGVIDTQVMNATVEYVNGSTATVTADDGFVYEVSSDKDEYTGAYPVSQ